MSYPFFQFLAKTFLFGNLCFAGLYFILSFEKGNADPIHQKLIGPKRSSFILGNSKYSQGILPSILNDKLEKYGFQPIYNFALAVNVSSYSPFYLAAIQEKLENKGSDGIFILGVDPYSLTLTNDLLDAKPEEWPDSNLPLAIHSLIPFGPHVSYLLQWYPYPFYEILIRYTRPANEILHSDGWLEVRVPMDSSSVNWRKSKILNSLKSNISQISLSEQRFAYLEKTIGFLQNHGKVFLVRFPSAPELMAYENSAFPNFDSLIQILGNKHQISYFNFTHLADSLVYTDGLHPYVDSGILLSNGLVTLIENHLDEE
ncbi:hypothetical protein EF405_12170 [Cyclobacteriaceae bacterium YHN15]|nr:hypothetical protein EF405_12170 [Cyclobacteriaceae bacterium YHN15]